MESIREQIERLGPDFLTGLARRALNAPTLGVSDWSVRPLAHEAVIETTGGVYRLEGSGMDGDRRRSWSVILKAIRHPVDDCLVESDLCYWRRELLAYQTGLLVGLPESIHAPRFFASQEIAAGAWLWLEEAAEGRGSWSLQDYHEAARALGRFAGAYLAGGTPVPDAPWLCQSMLGAKVSDDDWWAKYTNPASERNAWQHESVQMVYSSSRREQVLRIWEDKRHFLSAYNRLPRVFCHNDAHRKNMMLGAQDPLILIDWGFCGPGAVGSDLGQLVGTSLLDDAPEPDAALALETQALGGYVEGLREAGLEGMEQPAWLGYAISLALYWGATLPCAVAQVEMAGSDPHVKMRGWTTLMELSLERADEARRRIENGRG